jgi:hypothetical protein
MNNEIYLAKTYLALRRLVEAIARLKRVLEMETYDEIDKAHQAETRELLAQFRR